MPVYIGEAEAMAAFACKVWGIGSSKKKTVASKSKSKKSKKNSSHPKGMP